jgi:hypothetical protein
MEYQTFNEELKKSLSEELSTIEFQNVLELYNSFKSVVLSFESRKLPQVTGYSFAAEYSKNGFGFKSAALRLELQLEISDNGYDFMEYAFVEIDLNVPKNLELEDFYERYWTIEYKKLKSALEAFEDTILFRDFSKIKTSSLRFNSGEV